MTPFEVEWCEQHIESLRLGICKGGLDMRQYDQRCGAIQGIETVIRELFLKPNRKTESLELKKDFAA